VVDGVVRLGDDWGSANGGSRYDLDVKKAGTGEYCQSNKRFCFHL